MDWWYRSNSSPASRYDFNWSAIHHHSIGYVCQSGDGYAHRTSVHSATFSESELDRQNLNPPSLNRVVKSEEAASKCGFFF
ncbi:hypothetical protein THF1C08_200072 [Vibrio jasicida]|uniref:Uncharacterized protein n=1 Tax=Vibrio jasicida TaxID=766224 RepID=A0AAU9QLL6_9VIBR|nr:hypothetical protein THF1C08_200072 [Vibrio jasicida]CAH1589420.1 hypothetical protein THF1A12_210041 [Vibrio jasicida]